MQHFIINSSICLFVLWLVYKLLLENTSWHQFKRFYLLAALMVSIAIPFIVVKTVEVPLPSFQSLSVQTFDQVEQISIDAVPANNSFSIDWNLVLLAFYGIGFMVMLFRFMKNILGLRLKSTDQTEIYQGYRLVLRSKVVVPHSFLNTIYVDAADYRNAKIPQEVLGHEKAHLDQRHSIDILLIELLLVAAWFNPLVYVFKFSMKLNHEFLADQAVISSGADTKSYQETILKYAATSQNRALANTFNFPIIKKRFTIMKTKTSQTSLFRRTLAIIPVLALLILSCSQDAIQPQSESVIEKSSQSMPEDLPVEGLSGAMVVEGVEYYFKAVDGKNMFYDRAGNQVELDEDGSKIDSIRMFPKKGQVAAPKTGTLKYIEDNQDNLKYYIGNIEVTQSEAEQTIKRSGEQGVEITKNANGQPAIKITMTAEKRAKMPQFGSMRTKDGSIMVVTPTLVDANKNNDNELYKKKSRILMSAELQEKPADFYIDNEKVTVKEIHYLLHDNPKAGMSLKTKTDGSKALYLSSKEEYLSDDDLQAIYSSLFETHKNN